jgi:DNA primase
MDAVEQIKSRINIADLLREYIELKKAGANWKALCPFHSEKTPSLMVSEDKQIWHCFGCGIGGDIFGFAMRIEGLEFPEALKILAKKAGVELPKYDPAATSQKTKLADVLEAAAVFYATELLRSPAAMAYLKKRELADEAIKTFRIGFSPQQWDALLKFLMAKGFGQQDIALAGMAIRKEDGGFYDRFRGRIMFPIFNHLGNIVGFTARVLPELDDGKMGKYINTPETAVYKKSQILYGLNFAKQDIKKEDAVIVVEGNMDVIALHQAGFKNVVATSGTALTREQVDLIRRHTQNIIMSFDADSAGIEAAFRGIDVALAQGLNVKILEMPKNEFNEPLAKDPDELVKKMPQLWRAAVNFPKSVIDFYIDTNLARFNLSDPRKNSEFCGLILAQIKKIKNPVERSLWIKKLSRVSGVDEKDLRQLLPQISTARHRSETAASAQTDTAISGAEARYLSLLLSGIKENSGYLRGISAAMLKNEAARDFYSSLIFYYNDSGNDFKKDEFSAWLKSVGKNSVLFDKLLLLKDKDYAEITAADAQRELAILSSRIKGDYLREQRLALEQAMAEAERAGNRDKIKEILLKFKELDNG